MNDYRREALLKEYEQVCNNFRLLADIRFRMLAFVSIAAGTAAAFITTTLAKGNGIENGGSSLFLFGLALSLFGLVATIGLTTYNERNNQLYDELVGRAASIERSLGLPDGGFANRPGSWFAISIPFSNKSWKIDQRTGVSTVYAGSIALWLSVVLVPILEAIRQIYLSIELIPFFPVRNPLGWLQAMSLGLAVAITSLGAIYIKRQKLDREKEVCRQAKRAVAKAMELDISAIAENHDLIDTCTKLSSNEKDVISARARFYASLHPYTIRYYLLQGSREQTATHLVALLTDLSPQWLFDCTTDRRG